MTLDSEAQRKLLLALLDNGQFSLLGKSIEEIGDLKKIIRFANIEEPK